MKKAWWGESSSAKWGQAGDACLPLRLTYGCFLLKASQNFKNLLISIPHEDWDRAGAGPRMASCTRASGARSRACRGGISDVSLRSCGHVRGANYCSRLGKVRDPTAEKPPTFSPKEWKIAKCKAGLVEWTWFVFVEPKAQEVSEAVSLMLDLGVIPWSISLEQFNTDGGCLCLLVITCPKAFSLLSEIPRIKMTF